MRMALEVAVKELREIVRDRRALVSSLVYGLWGPLVMGLAVVAIARNTADDTVRIAVEGADRAPGLVAFLESRDVQIERIDRPAREALHARAVPVVMRIDDAYPRRVAASRPADVQIAFDSAWTASARTAARLRPLLSDYGQQVQDARLVLRGVAPHTARPLRVVDRDMATAAGRAAMLLSTLPIFLLLAPFAGGMAAAADVAAGERERGTLESLMALPVPRLSVVLGKWAAVSVVALATTFVTLFVSGLVLRHPLIQRVDLPVGLTGRDALAIAAVLVPLGLATAAAQLVLAFRSTSYKEAQTQLSYAMFVPMVPGFLLAFGAWTPAGWTLLLPVIGQHLAIAAVLRGEGLAAATAVGLALVALALATAMIVATTRLLDRESILRR